jgi:hypothetical protein
MCELSIILEEARANRDKFDDFRYRLRDSMEDLLEVVFDGGVDLPLSDRNILQRIFSKWEKEYVFEDLKISFESRAKYRILYNDYETFSYHNDNELGYGGKRRFNITNTEWLRQFKRFVCSFGEALNLRFKEKVDTINEFLDLVIEKKKPEIPPDPSKVKEE